MGGSFGAAKGDGLSEPTTTEQQQNSCCPFTTNKVLDELCICISNMLSNSQQPMVGPFRVGKRERVGISKLLSKKAEMITAAAAASGGEMRKPNEMNLTSFHVVRS